MWQSQLLSKNIILHFIPLYPKTRIEIKEYVRKKYFSCYDRKYKKTMKFSELSLAKAWIVAAYLEEMAAIYDNLRQEFNQAKKEYETND